MPPRSKMHSNANSRIRNCTAGWPAGCPRSTSSATRWPMISPGGGGLLPLRARAPAIELHPVRLLGQPQAGAARRRKAVPGPEKARRRLSRPEQARIRDQQEHLAAVARSSCPDLAEGAWPMPDQPAGSLFRHGLSRPLHAPDQKRRPHHSLRDRTLYQRQLHPDAAAKQNPTDEQERQLRQLLFEATDRFRPALRLRLRSDGVDRNQHGAERQRHVRSQFSGRTISSLRGLGGDIAMAALHAGGLQRLRTSRRSPT